MLFNKAITLQKIHMPLKVNLPMVNEINEYQDTTELDVEIEAVGAQLNRLKITIPSHCFTNI
jgi:hypothetical protein